MVWVGAALVFAIVMGLAFKPLVRRVVAWRLGPQRIVIEGSERIERIAEPKRVAVVGGGLAGIAAASTLAERGFEVELFEAEPYLGGKVGAWKTTLPDDSSTWIGHGFHAFFLNYYNLDRFLHGLGVRGAFRSIGDYQIVERDGTRLSFGGIDKTPILNLLSLWRRGVYSLGRIVFGPARDLMGVFLEYDRDDTYRRYDDISFAQFAEAAQLPRRLRLAFGTFARAFFADEDKMSLAELVKCFHFYFLGHDLGLVYDFPQHDYEHALIAPIRVHLEELGVTLSLGRPVDHLRRTAQGFEVEGEHFDDVVIATNVVGTKKILGAAEGIEPVPGLDTLRAGQRYAVQRLWLDRPFEHDIRDFVITESERVLDAVALNDRYEPEARAWAEDNGGAIVELHCYALPDDVPDDAVSGLLYDEFKRRFDYDATIVHEDLQIRRDFPAFHVGANATRPTVDSGTEGLYLAGDWVRQTFPTMLMEGAFTGGIIAANRILARHGVALALVESIPPRGVMAGMPSPPARDAFVQRSLRAQAKVSASGSSVGSGITR